MDDDDFDDFEEFEESAFVEEEVRFEMGFKHFEQMAHFGDTAPRDESSDPVVRFENFVFVVGRDMKSHGINLSPEDIRTIHQHIADTPHPGFKNPTAFILGYWVTVKDKKQINKTRFKRVESELQNMTYPVQPFDVVRYGNLWIEHLWRSTS